jgi:hypothetical protein
MKSAVSSDGVTSVRSAYNKAGLVSVEHLDRFAVSTSWGVNDLLEELSDLSSGGGAELTLEVVEDSMGWGLYRRIGGVFV